MTIIQGIILGLSIVGILTIGVYAQIAATYNWWPFTKKARERLDK